LSKNNNEKNSQGMVIKALSGFYYVQAGDRLWECASRGRFRYEKQQVLVGDQVEFIPRANGTGVIVKVLPRRVRLVRPPIANVDQAVIVISMTQPAPNPYLLDRLLLTVTINQIEALICFNKLDLCDKIDQELVDRYRGIYPVVLSSTVIGSGLTELGDYLQGKLSVFAGPSGVGKSTILNALFPELSLKTGSVSQKLKRGKHTTRHVELIPLAGGWVADTPGFSTLELPDLKPEDLAAYFPEMDDYQGKCYYTGCLHDQEPKCAVKDALTSGAIEISRYRQYLDFLHELKDRRRY